MRGTGKLIFSSFTPSLNRSLTSPVNHLIKHALSSGILDSCLDGKAETQTPFFKAVVLT